ncbi:release factor glutamine methyltransferase [Thiohalospira halophila DSM 15071]|uniref:Release factor glutamine methyltransferase n=1 Tax=Thiohalospira halophila DSM 15071 TaxID=1123397 RepID=A0A1I1TLP4_9GAMM|nr:peptide chain release factor N(5)-glutamine methyltransferase [Thiohalospira halophila]SFD59419.1 release factor glutamine methyltransferase [Thiohalospira halophila DSM 15071]
MTIDGLLAEAVAGLTATSDSPRLDAELLLAETLGRNRTWLRTWPEVTVEAPLATHFREQVARRAAGEPVAYLLGRTGFHAIDLAVTPATLIPRPETEELVERALELGGAAGADRARVLDIGTGSGAIALALAAARPNWTVTATDNSSAALAVAAANAAELGLERVELHAGDLFAGLTGPWELIVSNPPYIAADDPHLGAGDVGFEPRGALAAGPDGLDCLRRLAAEGPAHLVPGGWLLVEHGWDQGAAVPDLFTEAGLAEVATHRDLAGQERFTEGRRP